MSFLNKSFPMARNAGCLTDGETRCEASSRTEPKRAHQWFMEPSEQELFCNKRQAVEGVNSREMSGNPNMGFSLGENTSSFQPATGQFIDSLFGPERITTSNIAGRERKGFEDRVGNPSFVNLSMSYAREYPSCYLDYGVRKVKVNQVRDSQGDISLPLEYSYSRGDSHTISLNTHYNESDNGLSVGAPSDDGIDPAFREGDQNFVSIGQTCNKGDGNFTSTRHDYKGFNNVLSMGQPFNKGDGKYVIIDQGAGNGDDHIISMGPTYSKGPENLIPMRISYNKADENLIPMVHTFHKGNDSTIPVDPTHDKLDHIIVPLCNAKGDPVSSILSVGQNYNNAEGTTISFEGLQDDPEAYNSSGRMISSYDLLMSQALSEQGQNYSVEGNSDPNVSIAPVATSKSGTLSKKEQKATKKISPNSFPSNVKSLLSTGILDGVPVKYVSWSREKKLRGIIKGTSYLCGCQDCNLSIALNAYEFERHAGCKTKHPNNHIYFENGKTVYAVVQELKSTPQELLFEVITKVTGSPINQPNFNIWKGSYLAATRELARIYGNGEVAMQL